MDMKCSSMVQRLWVRTPVRSNLGCVDLLSKSDFNQIKIYNRRNCTSRTARTKYCTDSKMHTSENHYVVKSHMGTGNMIK